MKKLLYTTRADLSLEHFSDWNVIYYDTFSEKPQPADASPKDQQPADLVYFRDPFNDPSYTPDPAYISQLLRRHSGAHIVDRLTSFADILATEDKYLQSQHYGALYPATWLPSVQRFVPGHHLAKPRISQRAKDILFDLDGRELDDRWIIQELLDIAEELRVYTVYGEILQPASIKSSKASGAVKVIGTRELDSREEAFIRQALQSCPLDVVGFDLAVLKNGELRIIEANRSPQFCRYTERTGKNLAALIANVVASPGLKTANTPNAQSAINPPEAQNL